MCATYGNVNGRSGRFNYPWGVVLDSRDLTKLFVTDYYNNALRSVLVNTGEISTVISDLNYSSGLRWNFDRTSLFITNEHYIREVKFDGKGSVTKNVNLAGSTLEGMLMAPQVRHATTVQLTLPHFSKVLSWSLIAITPDFVLLITMSIKHKPSGWAAPPVLSIRMHSLYFLSAMISTLHTARLSTNYLVIKYYSISSLLLVFQSIFQEMAKNLQRNMENMKYWMTKINLK